MAKAKKSKKDTKAAKTEKKPKTKTNVAATLRAIREEAKVALSSGGRKPLNTILALVETGLKESSGKVSE